MYSHNFNEKKDVYKAMQCTRTAVKRTIHSSRIQQKNKKQQRIEKYLQLPNAQSVQSFISIYGCTARTEYKATRCVQPNYLQQTTVLYIDISEAACKRVGICTRFSQCPRERKTKNQSRESRFNYNFWMCGLRSPPYRTVTTA